MRNKIFPIFLGAMLVFLGALLGTALGVLVVGLIHSIVRLVMATE